MMDGVFIGQKTGMPQGIENDVLLLRQKGTKIALRRLATIQCARAWVEWQTLLHRHRRLLRHGGVLFNVGTTKGLDLLSRAVFGLRASG